ncbi:MAG: hypothetical protein ACRDBO_21010 [Lachnospiraceae bacterium]
MTKKRKGLIGCLIIIVSIFAIISIFVSYNDFEKKGRLEREYNRLIGPVAEYLENKYEERMILNDQILLGKDGVTVLIATPVNNSEVRFRIIDWGESRGGFRDDYLASHAEWEAKCIIDSIIERYCSNFQCSTILTFIDRMTGTGVLEEYYMENKEHLDWQSHFGKLESVVISCYEYEDSFVEQNIIEPTLSELLKLDFLINRVTFYLYESEGDKEAEITYHYEYENGDFQLRK